jgi:HEPN domain-containing protein
MKKPHKIVERKLEDAHRLIGYLGSSFDDYIASRILFNNNMLLQACCLANTAIEKCFKAFVDFKGNTIKSKHNLEKLLPSVKSFDSELYNKLNVEFLLELTKIYESRYIGDCQKGYNFVILRNKYLAELDYIYSLIEPKIRYSIKGKGIGSTNYESYISMKNSLIWYNNYLLNNIDKTDFIENLDYVHELRVYEFDGQLFEVKYHTMDSKDDGKFRIEGFKPKGDHKNFTLSHLPFEKNKE